MLLRPVTVFEKMPVTGGNTRLSDGGLAAPGNHLQRRQGIADSPERFAAAALFLGFNGRKVWLATAEGVTEVEPGELGSSWSGGYRLLWHPPEGFSGPLSLGDDSPVVAQVAALFARLDGQPQALAGNRFSPALETRVRLFQREHALEDDAVVGLQTLLKLNEALGIDPTANAARSLLAPGGDG